MNKTLKKIKDTIIYILRSRTFYVGLGIVVAMAAITARLYFLQIVQGQQYLSDAATVSKTILKRDTPRGNIYDRNGILLAANRVAYKVQMVNVKRDQSFRDSMYLSLIELFDENKEDYYNPFEKYLVYPIEWSDSLKGDENQAKRAKWINEISLKKSDRDKIKTAKDAFDYLRNTVFKFEEKYTDEQAYKIMIIRYQTYTQGLSTLVPMTLANDISAETMQIIEARHLDFPGVYTEEVYYRDYIHDETLSHLIGYVRAISSEEYESMKDEGYTKDSIIGKAGIERAAESLLRGTMGTRTVYQDMDTGIVKELESTEPVPGSDIYLTIDSNLQRVAYDALVKTIGDIREMRDDKKNFGDVKAGSVVVTNVRTGEVIAMANYPTYDNKIFLAPSSDEEAQKAITDLFMDPDGTSPSLNRATQGLYPVGSTFKPLVSVAALEEGVLTPYQRINCTGKLEIGNRIHKCNSVHRETDLIKALSESCNVFFYTTSIRLGIDKIDRWAKEFGLGEKTGIEITEYAGYRNNKETMKIKETDIHHIWSDSDTAQASIGQLYNLFTPLQVSNYAATLSNGGYLNTPHLMKSAVTKEGQVTYFTAPRKKHILKDTTLSAVRQGMVQMSRINSKAKSEFSGFPDGFVAGKTGTPQTGLEAFGRSSHSVYMCYAPANDPQISIGVIIEYGASGANSIAVAGEILRAYFGDSTSSNNYWSRQEGLSFGLEFRNFENMIKG